VSKVIVGTNFFMPSARGERIVVRVARLSVSMTCCGSIFALCCVVACSERYVPLDAGVVDVANVVDATVDATVDAVPVVDAMDAAPSGIYAIIGYCEGTYGAGCPAVSPCASTPDGLVGRGCEKLNDRCVVAGEGALATRVFACVPRATTWYFNGLSLAAWGATPGTFPVCIAGVVGASCTTIGERCVTPDERLFRCMPGGFTMWAFEDHCATATSPASFVEDCSGLSVPTCADANVAGTACPALDSRCRSDNKLFRCVGR
jgi:hypothetical protein